MDVTWEAISCKEADVLRVHLRVLSAKTDLSGEFGPPEVYTEWGYVKWGDEEDEPVMREHRWPDVYGGEDVAPCEHYKAVKPAWYDCECPGWLACQCMTTNKDKICDCCKRNEHKGACDR